jgi:hypothetical protein
LRTTEYQLGQLLAASVGKLLDQPRPKSVSNEYHASSLPATVQPFRNSLPAPLLPASQALQRHKELG